MNETEDDSADEAKLEERSPNYLKALGVLLIAAAVLVSSTYLVFGVLEPPAPVEPIVQSNGFAGEGPVVAPTISVGPFDLHRRYRSMEGPYALAKIKIGDLVRDQNVDVPKSAVKFLEDANLKISMDANKGEKSAGASPADKNPGPLYWLKGCKLEVLDETGKVLPDAEFICHMNIDVDSARRNLIFPEGSRCDSNRILTVTQGQTEMIFPIGFAVPVASDETWKFVFQAANRTTDIHRKLTQRLTLYLIKDESLYRPITAMSWAVPHVEVVVDKFSPEAAAKEKSECPLCLGEERGLNAPNSSVTSIQTDNFGRKVSGHWVVPPGKSTWASVIRDPQLGQKARVLHAAWAHVHPFCTTLSLVGMSQAQRRDIFTVHCSTKTKPGLQIEKIDYICSTKGIPLPADNKYELDVSYDNTSAEPADSMAAVGLFLEDNDFVRPSWAYKKITVAAKPPENLVAGAPLQGSPTKDYSLGPPIFDASKDGPILTRAKTVTVLTTDGKLKFELKPQWAPKTATQMAKLFQNHAYDGTEIKNYVPHFIFQIPLAEVKAPGYAPSTVSQRELVRRIPVEVESQVAQQVSHKVGVLSMARRDDDPFDNTSSFSILLGEGHHLDGKMTIFGQLLDDPENKKTLSQMISSWPRHPVIVKTLSVN